jgi:hypothetical protein
VLAVHVLAGNVHVLAGNVHVLAGNVHVGETPADLAAKTHEIVSDA